MVRRDSSRPPVCPSVTDGPSVEHAAVCVGVRRPTPGTTGPTTVDATGGRPRTAVVSHSSPAGPRSARAGTPDRPTRPTAGPSTSASTAGRAGGEGATTGRGPAGATSSASTRPTSVDVSVSAHESDLPARGRRRVPLPPSSGFEFPGATPTWWVVNHRGTCVGGSPSTSGGPDESPVSA